MPAMAWTRTLVCDYCKLPFEAKRSDARTCGPTCRQALSRVRKGILRSSRRRGGWSGLQRAGKVRWIDAEERRELDRGILLRVGPGRSRPTPATATDDPEVEAPE